MRKKQFLCSILVVLCLIITGCSKTSDDDSKYPTEYPSSPGYSIDDLLLPTSPETQVMRDEQQYVQIDYSNVSLGYIRVKRLLKDDVKMKIQIINESVGSKEDNKFHKYDLNNTFDEYVTFPIAYGNGTYRVMVYKNTYTNHYGSSATETFDVQLQNEQSPFLYPNQTVNYDQTTKTIQMSFDLCKEDTNDLQRIKTIYDYIVKNIKYDDEKSEATKNTYVLPVLDETLETKKGICFDYAALMAAMCRAQHIPCKVVVGDTEIVYHAWVEVWLEGKGWVNPEILFESDEWTRMDPTFDASNANYDGYYKTVFEY